MPHSAKTEGLEPYRSKGWVLMVLDMEGDDYVKLRRFKVEDIDKILEIEGQAFPKTAFAREDFLNFANSLPQGFVVVQSGRDIAGYMIFDMDGHILSMAVKPQFRRKGFGTAMFMHALKCTDKGLQLEVRSKNVGAISFYSKLGMRIAGRALNYYGDDDALVMVLNRNS